MLITKSRDFKRLTPLTLRVNLTAGDARAMKLSMVMPIFQEAERLEAALLDLQSFLARLPLEMELILVPEPTDAAMTRESLARIAGGPRPLRLCAEPSVAATTAPSPAAETAPSAPPTAPIIPVRVLDNPRRRGRGASVQRGLDAATGDFLIVLSADLNVPLAESFAAVQEFLRDPEGTGLILGNRRSLKRPRHGARPPRKKIFDDIEHEKSKGLDVPDPTSSFFAITKEWWRRISEGPGGPLKLRRWYYTPEIVRRIRVLGAPLKSLDINSHDSDSTRFRWWHSLIF